MLATNYLFVICVQASALLHVPALLDVIVKLCPVRELLRRHSLLELLSVMLAACFQTFAQGFSAAGLRVVQEILADALLPSSMEGPDQAGAGLHPAPAGIHAASVGQQSMTVPLGAHPLLHFILGTFLRRELAR